MMTSSNGNIFRVTGHLAENSPVPGEFPLQRPVTRSFDVFVDLRLNNRLSKQSWGWWFETLSRQLWRHCNEYAPNLMWCLWFYYKSYIESSIWRPFTIISPFYIINSQVILKDMDESIWYTTTIKHLERNVCTFLYDCELRKYLVSAMSHHKSCHLAWNGPAFHMCMQ